MIPLATTSIAVLRVPDDGGLRDGYDPRPAPTTVASGIRAHLSTPDGGEDRPGGSRQALTAALLCDPTDVRHTDLVLDETTGQTWTVTTVRQSSPLGGLGHVAATLEQTTGVGP